MTPEEKIEMLEKAIKQATDLLIQSSKTDDPAVDWAAKTTALGVLLKATEEKKTLTLGSEFAYGQRVDRD
jgi:LPS O-antigen subunit length determinant protein (WzzB/FepE family)